MIIQIFSKDGKRGISAGSTSLTPEKLTAALIAASAAMIVSAVGGLADMVRPKKQSRAGASKKSTKKKKAKKALPLLVAPAVYKALKPSLNLENLLHVAAGISDGVEEEAEKESLDEGGVEVIDAIPISSESEVYDHI